MRSAASASESRFGGRLKAARNAQKTPPKVQSNTTSIPTHGPDWWLLGLALTLVALGLTMVFSSGSIAAIRLFNDQYFFFKRQVTFAVIGLFCMYTAYVVPRSFIEKLQYPILLLTFAALIFVFSPFGISVNGAKRWINLGFIRIQPMEFAKIALVLYLAFFLSTKQHIIKTFSRGVIPPFLITALLCLLLLLQPDFGGAAVLTLLLFFLCLVGGTRLIYLIFSALLACGAGALLIIMEPYRFQRLTSFMDPFANAQKSGYQLVQALYAIGSGGVFGLGLGGGRQKLHYLPESHTDFIMAVLAEELGLVGITIIFILLALLIWRGVRIAVLQPELRGRLTAFGLTLILAIPMLLNMAVVSASVPSKGVPMPFFSYGGTSLLSSMICVGLLLNYSRITKK